MSKTRLAAALVVCALTTAGYPAPAQSSQPATLKLDLKAPRAKVSPMLYGLMTEEINFSYDGGLYAEMVRNRTFQTRVDDWFLIQDGNAQASMSVDKTTGPSEALPLSLKGGPGWRAKRRLLGYGAPAQHILQRIVLCQGR
jgi:alpha-N-arabinofuranosidase